MPKPEAKFWAKIKAGLKAPGFDAVRIESGLTNRGIPDVNVAHAGMEVWVELKVLSKGTRPKISHSQRIWHLKRSELGCRTWFAIQVLTTPERVLLYKGSVANQLVEKGIAYPPHAEFEAPYDWRAFREALFR